MSVFVCYQVPMLVEVDIDSGRVVRVRVDDEAAPDLLDVFAIDSRELSREERDSAVEIANRETWPAWEFGA